MEINLGNSGTGIRLISGLIGGLGLHATLTGDDSLSKRPMKRITKPLSEMGINIFAESNRPPLQFKGAKLQKKFRYHMPVASAQLKSCLLFNFKMLETMIMYIHISHYQYYLCNTLWFHHY